MRNAITELTAQTLKTSKTTRTVPRVPAATMLRGRPGQRTKRLKAGRQGDERQGMARQPDQVQLLAHDAGEHRGGAFVTPSCVFQVSDVAWA